VKEDYFDNFYGTLNYDYFGMLTVGRSWSVGSEYRYGFNGQEQDVEVYGNGNLNTAEFWEYDTRLGRRWNLDPIDFTWLSPYATFNLNPILNLDKKGAKADWFQSDSDGSVEWIDSEADWYTDVDGDSYTNLGVSIKIYTSSDIKLASDIPLSKAGVDGLKLRCEYTIEGVKKSDGTLDYYKTTYGTKIGKTFDKVKGASSVKGKINDYIAVTKAGSSWVGAFEHHTEVNCVEKWGLENILGAKAVDVNVSVMVSISSSSKLELSISHGTYPSVDM